MVRGTILNTRSLFVQRWEYGRPPSSFFVIATYTRCSTESTLSIHSFFELSSSLREAGTLLLFFIYHSRRTIYLTISSHQSCSTRPSLSTTDNKTWLSRLRPSQPSWARWRALSRATATSQASSPTASTTAASRSTTTTRRKTQAHSPSPWDGGPRTLTTASSPRTPTTPATSSATWTANRPT